MGVVRQRSSGIWVDSAVKSRAGGQWASATPVARQDGAWPSQTFNIGETTITPTADSGNANLLIAQPVVLPAGGGTIQSLSFYVTTAAGQLYLGIYDATGPSGKPGALKATTAVFTPIVGWNTVPVTVPVSLSAGTYWLAYTPSSSTLAFRKQTASPNPNVNYGRTFAALPATFSTTPSTSTTHFSFYATFSSTPPPPPSGNPSGVSVPTADLPGWHNIFWDDFTLDAPIGSFASASDPSKIVYTGAQGQKWQAYPQTYLDSYQNRPYRSDAVLSVSNSCLDFYLHNVDGIPAGANPSPVITGTSREVLYGRFSTRFRVTNNTLSEYYVAWMVVDANNYPMDGEEDWPEGNLNGNVSGFHHAPRALGSTVYDQIVANVPAGTVFTDWHTYTHEWTPGRMRFLLDDVVVLDSTQWVPTGASRWQLQTETNGFGTHQGHLECDWVSVWAYAP
jgi:hypothetical protein